MLSACAVQFIDAGLIELSTTLLVRQRIDILTGSPIGTTPVAMDPNQLVHLTRRVLLIEQVRRKLRRQHEHGSPKADQSRS